MHGELPATPINRIAAATRRIRSELGAALRNLDSLFDPSHSEPKLYERWLQILIEATEAAGGAVHELHDGNSSTKALVGVAIASICAMSDPASNHAILRRRIIDAGKPTWFRASLNNSLAGQTVYEAVAVPTTERHTPSHYIELYFSRQNSPERRRLLRRFVVAAARKLKFLIARARCVELELRQEKVDDAVSVLRSIHAAIDVRSVAYAVVNQGVRYTGYDRLTVLVRHRSSHHVVAVSGQDCFDTRSPTLKSLVALSRHVAAVGEPLLSGPFIEDLGPAFAAAFNHHLDVSNSRKVDAYPIFSPKSNKQPNLTAARELPIGVVIAEQFGIDDPAPGFDERLRFIAEHTGQALQNAIEHKRSSLRMLSAAWRILDVLAATPITKSLGVLTAFVVIAVVLFVIPFDFTIHANAVMQPSIRRDVFAPADAIVERLFVRHGDDVEPGTPLIRLHSSELSLAVAAAEGARSSVNQQLDSIQRALFDEEARLSPVERVTLAGRRAELQHERAALDDKLSILERRCSSLEVRSPIAGRVLTWDVDRLLRNRPVQEGQVLLTIADVSGEWHLEAYVADSDIGRLSQFRAHGAEALPVTYRTHARPEFELLGNVEEIRGSAEASLEKGNTVLVRVTLTGDRPPQATPGAEAAAKFHCGKSCLVYVWLHDAIDFLRTRVWFRMC